MNWFVQFPLNTLDRFEQTANADNSATAEQLRVNLMDDGGAAQLKEKTPYHVKLVLLGRPSREADGVTG